MYAVVSCGGKQYRVSPGDIFRVEKLNQPIGEKVELNQVLLINQEEQGVKVGTPLIKGAKVICSLVEERKAKKVIVFKMKRRKGYRRKKGHRQIYSLLKVEDILIENTKAIPEAIPKTKPKVEAKLKAKPKAKAEAKPKAKSKAKTKAEAEPKVKTKTKSKSAAKSKK